MHFFQRETEIWTYLARPVALPGSLQCLTSQFKCLGFRDGSCCPSTSADALEPFANSDWQLSFFSHVVLLYFIYLRSIDRRELRDDGSIRFNKIKYISDLIFLYIGDKEWMYRPDDHATMKRKTLRRKTLRRNTLRNGTHIEVHGNQFGRNELRRSTGRYHTNSSSRTTLTLRQTAWAARA